MRTGQFANAVAHSLRQDWPVACGFFSNPVGGRCRPGKLLSGEGSLGLTCSRYHATLGRDLSFWSMPRSFGRAGERIVEDLCFVCESGLQDQWGSGRLPVLVSCCAMVDVEGCAGTLLTPPARSSVPDYVWAATMQTMRARTSMPLAAEHKAPAATGGTCCKPVFVSFNSDCT